MLEHAQLQALVGTARSEASKEFYNKTLGLTLESEDQFALTFKISGGTLRVSKVPTVAPSPYAVVGFAVKDVETAAAELTLKGVRLERFPFLMQDAQGVWTAPDGSKVAWFRDPDLNLLSISQSQ